jgi:cytochrome c
VRRAGVALLGGLALAAPALGGCREESVTPRRAVAGGDAARGRATIARFGCGGCHVVPGVPGAVGRVGPPLDALAGRAVIAGTLPNEPEALVRWIRDPQAVRPGTAMPDLGLGEREARDVAAYLYAVEQGGLGPPHPLPRRWLPEH